MKKTCISLFLLVALLLTLAPWAAAHAATNASLLSTGPATITGEGASGLAAKPEDDDPHYLALTAKNFPDKNFREHLISTFQSVSTTDGAGITYLSKSTVLETTILEMNLTLPIGGDLNAFLAKNAFTTLKGIELFPNLIKLDCMYRSLTALDLSANPNITLVQCSRNNLTSLTVSENNQALQLVDCTNNKLQSLDLSGASNLGAVNCSSNPLTSLILPNSEKLDSVNAENCQLTKVTLPATGALESLSLQNNKLSSLDISGQSKLYRLELDGNQFATLTVEGLPALEQLTVSDNPLTVLNLANLPVLQTLKCTGCRMSQLALKNLPQLIQVDCSGSQLKTLTLDDLPWLDTLDCSNNQLTGLDCSGLPNLQFLTCEKNRLTSLTLSGLPKLKNVNANINQLADLNLSDCPGLVNLRVAYNDLTTLDFSGCPNVDRLEIAGNRMPYLDLSGHPAQLAVYYTDAFDYATPHRVSGKGSVSGGVYTFDLKSLIPLRQFRASMETEGVTCNTNTGIVTLPSALTSFQYMYLVQQNSLHNYYMVVEVTVTDYTDPDEVDDPHYLALTEQYFPDSKLRALVTEKLEAMGLVKEEGGVKYVSRFNTKKVKELDLSLDPDGIRWADLIDTDPAQYRANLEPYTFTSLEGLGYFSQLTSLQCRQRGLTELNASGFSKLTYLDCSYNEITYPTLPKTLKTLNCTSNHVRGLDLGEFKALTTVLCSRNGMTSLTVPTGIVRLECADNRLTYIILQGVAALEQLDCGGNLMPSLDVTEAPALQRLVCDRNQFSMLDVSKNLNLQELNCANNRLSSVNLAPNAKLVPEKCVLDGQHLATQNLLQTGSGFTCDLGALVIDTAKVTLITAGGTYSSASGIVTFAAKVDSFEYRYDTGRGTMTVTVPVKTIQAAPPTIKTQPKNANVKSGSKAKFTVKVKEKNVTYQWLSKAPGAADWTPMAGETKATLTVVASKANSGTQYRCRVRTAEGGEAYTNPATLTVKTQAPAIKTQPKSLTVVSGKKAKFTVKASGPKLTYTWYSRPNADADWTVMAGQNKNALNLVATAANNGWQFRCVVKNGDGEVTSGVATLTVTKDAPVIKTQPKSVTVKGGAKAKFSVKASGKGLNYQWFSRPNAEAEWTALAGQNKAKLELVAGMDKNGWQFRCVVKNADGEVTSSIATLTVTPQAPKFSTQPKDAKVKVGAKAKFKVKASGKNVTYQWYYRTSEAGEWVLMEGETSANLTVVATEGNIGWQFRCLAKNADGQVYSKPATLLKK